MRLAPLLLTGCIMEGRIGGTWPDPTTPPDDLIDEDGDGITVADGDCDDREAEIHPGHAEICDAFDNDCNGKVNDNGNLNVCAAREIYEQELKADVLVVLDTTVSMYDNGYVSLARDGAASLLEPLRGPGMDTHIGVISMDMESPFEQGRLREAHERRWVSGDDGVGPQIAELWLQDALWGEGFGVMNPASARATIDAALFDHVDGYNDGFFRTDADLAVLLVSDGDDLSSPGNNELLTSLRNRSAGTDADVTFYAITWDQSVCGDKKERSDSLLELVALTEGMYDSICRSEYGGFMTGVAQDIANNALGSVFKLPSPAQLGSVWVTVTENSGASYAWAGVAMRDPWTLVFEPRPPAGSTITVDYLVDWTR